MVNCWKAYVTFELKPGWGGNYLHLASLAVDKLKRTDERVKNDGRLLARVHHDRGQLTLYLDDCVGAPENVHRLVDGRDVNHQPFVAILVFLVSQTKNRKNSQEVLTARSRMTWSCKKATKTELSREAWDEHIFKLRSSSVPCSMSASTNFQTK
jgi:hypothetical protein